MGDRTISILAPWAEQVRRVEPRAVASRLATLHGARLGFVYNTFLSIGVIHDELRRLLAPDAIEAIPVHKKFWRVLDPEQSRDLGARADAVIGGLGNTSPSTVCAIRDAVGFESLGRPTVTFVTDYYDDLFGETAAAAGMPELRRIVLSSALERLPRETLVALAATMVEHVVAALTDPASPTVVRL